ncbi:hypothetical protein CDAR_434301 [Caerostris darwini]|uniref:Uncharacterized protein n=1 Tax=Caerostris darwini TaxID=1538125 RepID=A0AAV4U9T1_9ARAC|nr:hypothetical protein CDAR_434301 [Caerostris darwini]
MTTRVFPLLSLHVDQQGINRIICPSSSPTLSPGNIKGLPLMSTMVCADSNSGLVMGEITYSCISNNKDVFRHECMPKDSSDILLPNAGINDFLHDRATVGVGAYHCATSMVNRLCFQGEG